MKRNTLDELLQRPWARRRLLQLGGGALLASALPSLALAGRPAGAGLLGFKPVAVADLVDEVVVPEGYRAEVFYAWGDPVSAGPAFRFDAGNSADEQALQAGMHHDAIAFFTLPREADGVERGLLVMNHEYIDAQILHADGGVFDEPDNYTPEKTRKEQHAHGVSVIEVENAGRGWLIRRPSRYARRLTANTPMSVAGPVAGHALLRTDDDPAGRRVLGTFNNCANGVTPWGTYLTCEENFNDYFHLDRPEAFDAQRRQRWERYSLGHSYYGWHLNDARFHIDRHPNESNRFGWVVEFDPRDPASRPIKRTALGRFSHENVACRLAADGRVAFYSGDDAGFEYLYKFVTRQHWDGTQGAHHGALLDDGVLYAARLDDEGRGSWLPLVHGLGPLTQENGFADQADVLVHARLAADAVGATALDRPEWVATHPQSGDVYVSLTNNESRGQPEKAGTDAANPRGPNPYGHIIRLVEGDAGDAHFDWDIFALAGDRDQRGSIQGDSYANPDGMMIDQRGVLWVQTDISGSRLNAGEFARFGNNQMLAVDPLSGETRRFLTGPNGCEVTGVVMAPDMRTMWVNIQHPGEASKGMALRGVKKSALRPDAISRWPDQRAGGRPRSATVMITRHDGGIIGAE